MKAKKIVSTIAAVSVLAMSSMSFAITFENAGITTLTNKKANAQIKIGAGSTLQTLMAEETLTLTKDASVNLESVTVSAKKNINLSSIKVSEIKTATGVVVTGNDSSNEPVVDTSLDSDVKQKCETLLYKQVA